MGLPTDSCAAQARDFADAWGVTAEQHSATPRNRRRRDYEAYREPLLLEQVDEVRDEVCDGIVDDNVTVEVAHLVAAWGRRQVAVEAGRERAEIADVAKGEVSADVEDGAADAVDVGQVAEIVAAEVVAVILAEVVRWAILWRASPLRRAGVAGAGAIAGAGTWRLRARRLDLRAAVAGAGTWRLWARRLDLGADGVAVAVSVSVARGGSLRRSWASGRVLRRARTVLRAGGECDGNGAEKEGGQYGDSELHVAPAVHGQK
jgi:hypothetical protein